MIIVADTNILVSALIVKVGKPAQILKHINKKFTLYITEEILLETNRALHYPHIRKRYPITDQEIKLYIEELRKVSIVVKSKIKVRVVKNDPDDDKFLALAKEGKADCIVSGDPHLTKIDKYEGIPILTPAEFLALISTSN